MKRLGISRPVHQTNTNNFRERLGSEEVVATGL
jgi:hypothetical protein